MTDYRKRVEKMSYNKEIGRIGENKAKNYLTRRGYKILETNYNIRGGELDIIAKDNECICFVEVKTRTNDEYGAPADAVGYTKQQRMMKAAKVYIAKIGHDIECRFDVIEVFYNPNSYLKIAKINHLKNVMN